MYLNIKEITIQPICKCSRNVESDRKLKFNITTVSYETLPRKSPSKNGLVEWLKV
jgi:hypothetical protein